MTISQPTPKSEILLAFTAGDSPALGTIWRITGKSADFYLDASGPTGETMHVSLHGPRGAFKDHRFHIKIDRKAVKTAREAGHFVAHQVPARGRQFSGRRVADNAYHVARLRWRWHLQRPRYRSAAIFGAAPDITDGQTGRKMATIVAPNSAWDVDIYMAYDKPYWPWQLTESYGDPRMGPVKNDVGMWLTAISVHRAETLDPSPPELVPRLPRLHETPNRLTCGGLGPRGEDDLYWFVETITARELIDEWQEMDGQQT